MKIAVAPPLQFMPPPVRAAAEAVEPPSDAPPADPLAFARVMTSGERSEIDEAAVALVHLSVLVYKPLETIRRVFARLGVAPAVFDPWQDRAVDLQWLERQAGARAGATAFARLLGEDKPVTATPVSFMDGTVKFLHVHVDMPVRSEKNHADQESQALRDARQKLAEAVRANAILVPASDDDIGRDFRNRPPRVIAFRHGDKAFIGIRGSSVTADFKRDATIVTPS